MEGGGYGGGKGGGGGVGVSVPRGFFWRKGYKGGSIGFEFARGDDREDKGGGLLRVSAPRGFFFSFSFSFSGETLQNTCCERGGTRPTIEAKETYYRGKRDLL